MSTLICVDNGGTLTDAIAVREGRFFRAKAITTPTIATLPPMPRISWTTRLATQPARA